jgi:uncharacterized protein YutE (UPF0331/DUF86 family)
MGKAVLEEKLESLRRCLARVQGRVPPSAAQLHVDLDAQDIITINLERAVQLCVDSALHVLSVRDSTSPKSMTDAFAALAREGIISETVATRLGKAVGFRNIAVHAYDELDWDIVYSIATLHLDDFKNYMRELMAWVELHLAV